MARGKKTTVKMGGNAVRRLVKTPSGTPNVSLLKKSFSVKGYSPTLKPLFQKNQIRKLIKRDPAKGLEQPEADNMTTTAGILTKASGGYKGASVIRQRPFIPAPTMRLSKVIEPPRAGQGKLKVFNKVTSVRGSRKRIK